MSKAVAVDGGVSAQASKTTVVLPAKTGTWAAGPVTCQKYAGLTADGVAVIWQATCTFIFTGSDANGGAVGPIPDVVTLSAGATKLQGAENGVILDGDQVSSSAYQNVLVASSTGKLRG